VSRSSLCLAPKSSLHRLASVFMFIASAAPNKHSLGATNGMGQTVVSVVRAIGPALSNSLFALSLEHNALGGYAVYAIFVVISAISLLLARRLPKEPWRRDINSQ
jgi:hypothetical protein